MEEGALSHPRPLPGESGHTLEAWAGWEGRWELIHGVAFDMTPAPSYEHQLVGARLLAGIFHALEEAKRQGGKGECDVLCAPLDVFLEGGVVEPDLVIVCDPAKKSVRGIEGAPDLVVEILSPGTAAKDLTRKRWLYESAGVPEYLVVDPLERVGLLLRLEAGKYEEAARVEWGGLAPLLGGRLSVTLG